MRSGLLEKKSHSHGSDASPWAIIFPSYAMRSGLRNIFNAARHWEKIYPYGNPGVTLQAKMRCAGIALGIYNQLLQIGLSLDL
jgi:hypothetical protein